MSNNLPDLWLSMRQPWAWLIVNGWKNVENRPWSTKVRGRVGIHAAKGMTIDEWRDAYNYVCRFAPKLAAAILNGRELQRGGIVGETTILDCVQFHSSEWFQGPYGFVVADSKPLPFIPCPGALGFFRLATVNGQLRPVWGKAKAA